MKALVFTRGSTPPTESSRMISTEGSHWDARLAPLYRTGWRDIRHAEIVLPSRYEGDRGMLWARNRSELWNLAQYSDNGSDARIAQGFIERLPAELDMPQKIALSLGFAQALADQHRTAVDFAIHRPHSRQQSAYLHLFSTVREISAEGFGERALHGSRVECEDHRRLWENYLQRALQNASLGVSLEQGQGREPRKRLEHEVQPRSVGRDASR